ncbi:hypothetical protein QNN00_12970 [Bacillus velezensis]|nr:hypothetical protein [Bacillus velezensis]
MQLFHKTLVPSLHSETMNPYLRLEDSPFYVRQKPSHGKGRRIQRTAVSMPARDAQASVHSGRRVQTFISF